MVKDFKGRSHNKSFRNLPDGTKENHMLSFSVFHIMNKCYFVLPISFLILCNLARSLAFSKSFINCEFYVKLMTDLC